MAVHALITTTSSRHVGRRAQARRSSIEHLIQACQEAERALPAADAKLDEAFVRYRALGGLPAPARDADPETWADWTKAQVAMEEASGVAAAEATANAAYDRWVGSMSAIAAASAGTLDGMASKARLAVRWFEDPEVWRHIESFEADKVRVALSVLRDVLDFVGGRSSH